MNTVTQDIREFLSSKASRENVELTSQVYIYKSEVARLEKGYTQLEAEYKTLQEAYELLMAFESGEHHDHTPR